MGEFNGLIRPELIIPDLTAVGKRDAIRKLVDRIFEVSNGHLKDVSRDYVCQQILSRENLMTTSVENGLAFPHALVEGCSDLIIAIGVSKKGVDFDSRDMTPSHIICLTISPDDKPYIHLQAKAAIRRFLSEQKNIDEIFSAPDTGKIAGILNNAGGQIHKSVLARELMRPVARFITLDTTIEQTMRVMHQSKLDILPVVDNNNILKGQLSCPRIFSYGVPNFFKQLQTVSFVKYLDPFEKYFRLYKDLKVKDIYDPCVVSVKLDSTLMEIIFEMATRFRSRLYVVDEGKLAGEIDRFCIIEKILFC